MSDAYGQCAMILAGDGVNSRGLVCASESPNPQT